MNSHIYHGKKYNSVVQLAKAAGVDRTALNRAILKNKNTPVEELIQKIKDSKVSYNYKGKVYFSIREASKDLDLKPETISKYLKLSNNDLEVAMNLYLDEHTYAIVDGVRYSSGDDLAKALGVTRTTLDKYVKLAAESSITTDENAEKNATMAESIKIAVENIKKMKETKFFWKDKEYTSFSALARAMGMSTPTLHRYLDLYKESSLDEIYELYNTLNAGKYKTYTYGEKEYSSLKNMLKDLGISTQTYYRELSQNGGNSKQAIAQLLQKKEEEIAKKEAALLAIEQREKNKPTYIFNGKAYSSKAEVAKLANISESQASRLLDEYDNNLDIALEHKKEKIIYNYGGKEYPSIVALAEATGIKEARLGRYIRKYDRDAEKAILMITLRDSRRKKSKENNLDISTQDMAIILGIKHRDLEALLNSGMTIDEIKENLDKVSSNSSKSSFRAPVLMYDDKQSLRDYCIKNGFNYSCIYYGMSTYGKTQEEAIQNYKQNGQKIPTTWIFEKYGVLLKHLLLSENIDSSSVVARMRALGISFEESIENYIIDDVSKKRDLDKFWQRELYSCITLDLFSEEEKKDFLKEFMITPDELQAVDESKTKIEHVKRKMLLFEMAECLQNKVFSHDEMVDIMRIYDVTGDEVETIFLDLYSQFNNKVLLGSNQDELEKRQQIITYIKGLPNYSEEDISNLKTKLSEEEFTYILETSDLMQDYKQAVTTDVNLLKLMKNTVRENLATNAVTRSEILEEPQKAKNITTK